ncbi:MAG: hypothetical protein AAF333_03465 [Planctomycetota bacterium]
MWRVFSILTIACSSLFPGCGQAEDAQWTEQQKLVASAIKTASIQSTEKLLDRKLSDDDKRCIVIEFEDGYPVASIASPLAETILSRENELDQQRKALKPNE